MFHKRLNMTRTSISLLVVVLAALTVAAVTVGQALATPPSPPGTTVVTGIADGRLPVDIPLKFKAPNAGFGDGLDVERILVSQVEVQPGGDVGWHQHSGPVWVVVQQGTFTVYDEFCQAEPYPAGTVYLDQGDRTHNARNEGTDVLRLAVVFMLPEGGAARIDVPTAPPCSFPPLH